MRKNFEEGGIKIPDLEKSFSDFLDSNDYDRLQGTLLSAIRAAYNAGWIAADGEEPSRKTNSRPNNRSTY